MKEIKAVLNKVVSVYLDQGVVELFLAGRDVVIEVGRNQIVVPANWLSPDILAHITDRFYSPPKHTSPIKIVRILRQMLDTYMYLDFVNIDRELDALEASWKRSHKKARPHDSVFRSNPPGRVHFRFKENKRKYLLVSNSPANTKTLYEQPMANQLSRYWPFGNVLKSFCLLYEHRTGWERLFELDAIAINKSDLFVFEMKNRKYTKPLELLSHFREAALSIRKWTQKMGTPVSKFIPIIYLKHESDSYSPILNHLLYSTVQQGIPDAFFRSLIAYPIPRLLEIQTRAFFNHST